MQEPPAVVIAAKSRGGTVVDVASIDNRADLVQRNPSPGEFDIGNAALPGDAGYRDQFAAGGGKGEGLFFRIAGSDETLKCVHACGRECDVPAGRRCDSRPTGGVSGGNPAAMLEQEIVRREVVCVGKNAGAKLEQLYRAERAGSRDQVGGEAAG